MGWITGLLSLFGGGGSGVNVAKQVADVVQDYKPGKVTEHKMALESIKAEDDSQASARSMVFTPVGGDWFNKIIDGLNRLPRPIMALWAFGVLVWVLPVPAHLMLAPPLVLNIIWTVIGFYFGVRTISQDLPKLLASIRK